MIKFIYTSQSSQKRLEGRQIHTVLSETLLPLKLV